MKAIPALCAVAACFIAGYACGSDFPDKGEGMADVGHAAVTDAITIPEPGLAVLLGLVGVFLLLRRR